ncbi:MAG: GDP-mannose 4,6-dehydratase [Bacteroidota bacterium]
MKILLTGSEGFIGKALKKRLLAEGHSVKGYDIEQGDIAAKNAFENYKDSCEHVIHLAARTFVPDSWNDPYDFFRVNILGTVNVLDHCKECKSSVTLVSSYPYGHPDYLPVDELHPVRSYNPYAESKNEAEKISFLYNDFFDLPVVSLRTFNIYGPGQPAHFLIPTILNQLMDKNIPEVVVQDLFPKRDYVFIDDVVNAIMKSLKGDHGIFNLGSGISYSVEEIIRMMMELSGIEKPYKSEKHPRPNEVNDVVADIRKINQVLGWTPETDIRKGLTKCIEAYRAQ